MKLQINRLDLTMKFFFFLSNRPPAVDQGPLIHEVSSSHTTTHNTQQDSSGRVISQSQRPLPDNTRHSQQTNIHAPGGIRTHNLSRRAAADLHLRPRGHWDRRSCLLQLSDIHIIKMTGNLLVPKVPDVAIFFLVQQSTVGQGLLIHDVSRSHSTTHHSRQDFSGRVISSSQRPLSDNIQPSQQTDIHAPLGFELTISTDERPQTYALESAATGTGCRKFYYIKKIYISLLPFHFRLRIKFRTRCSFLHALYTHPPLHHSNGIWCSIISVATLV